jgi:hypothetical protein
MKKVLTITVAALLACLTLSAAQAAVDSWRIAIKADNGAGSYAAPSSQFGVYPTSSNDVDTVVPTQDLEASYGVDTTQTFRWVVGYIPGDTRTWGRDFLAPGTGTRSWYIRVAAGPLANADPIRLLFYTLGTAVLPPPTVGVAVSYRLYLRDNKGVQGAPANNTYWDLPIPDTNVGLYYTLPINLPILKLASYGHTNMLDGGYQLELQQIPVPEPSGLMALGMGATGLIGFMLRRRRA